MDKNLLVLVKFIWFCCIVYGFIASLLVLLMPYRPLVISGFWRRHKRKVLVTTGVLGGGYLLYKLYNAHSQRLAGLEAELAREQESSDELLKAK